MSIKSAETAIEKAWAEISDILAIRTRKEILTVSRRYKGKRVGVASAMGTWSASVTMNDGSDKEIQLPVFKLYENMLDKFGWNAIPAPLFIYCQDGEELPE